MIGSIAERQKDVVDIQHVHPMTGKHSQFSYIHCRNPEATTQLLSKFQAHIGRSCSISDHGCT
eukprot:6960580-Karenia_brevis.AAC.1